MALQLPHPVSRRVFVSCLTVVDQREAYAIESRKEVMTFITNRELCSFRKTQHSRVCPSHAAVTHSCVIFTINRNPKAAQGTSEN